MADLTTVASVKAWLQTSQQPYPPTDDAMLARLITAASVFIESWTARPIGQANWQEIRDGNGGSRMLLWATPITAILGVAIRDGNSLTAIPPLPGAGTIFTLPNPTQQIIPSFTGPNAAIGYSFTATELCVSGWCFYRGFQNIIVQYTAGYEDIPGDIEQACIELVVQRYRERTRIGEVSRSLGGAETVAYSQKDMSDGTKAMLRQYRQAAPLLAATQIPPTPQTIEFEDDTTSMELEDSLTPMVQEQ